MVVLARAALSRRAPEGSSRASVQDGRPANAAARRYWPDEQAKHPPVSSSSELTK